MSEEDSALAPCPWCGKLPKRVDSPKGVSFECSRDECPTPDDAALAVGWPYLRSSLAAAERWNVAAEKDAARKLSHDPD